MKNNLRLYMYVCVFDGERNGRGKEREREREKFQNWRKCVMHITKFQEIIVEKRILCIVNSSFY